MVNHAIIDYNSATALLLNGGNNVRVGGTKSIRQSIEVVNLVECRFSIVLKGQNLEPYIMTMIIILRELSCMVLMLLGCVCFILLMLSQASFKLVKLLSLPS